MLYIKSALQAYNPWNREILLLNEVFVRKIYKVKSLICCWQVEGPANFKPFEILAIIFHSSVWNTKSMMHVNFFVFRYLLKIFFFQLPIIWKFPKFDQRSWKKIWNKKLNKKSFLIQIFSHKNVQESYLQDGARN